MWAELASQLLAVYKICIKVVWIIQLTGRRKWRRLLQKVQLLPEGQAANHLLSHTHRHTQTCFTRYSSLDLLLAYFLGGPCCHPPKNQASDVSADCWFGRFPTAEIQQRPCWCLIWLPVITRARTHNPRQAGMCMDAHSQCLRKPRPAAPGVVITQRWWRRAKLL